MVKKILTVSAVTAMLLLSGCNNDAEDRMQVQQDLDSGNYGSVITYYENVALEDMTDDEKLKVATAHMGQAGFSATDLISLVSVDEEANQDDVFQTFIASVDGQKSDTAIEDLQSAIDYYTAISTVDFDISEYAAPSLVSETPDLSDLDSTELFLGLAYITKVATVFGYFGDVTTWNETGSDDDLSASACAMVYVYENTLANGCDSVVYSGTTTIDSVDYTNVNVTYNSELYERLANSDASELVLTDYDTNLPVQDENLTVKEALIQSINLGFEAVEAAAPDDVKEKVTEYKTKIDANADGEITVSEFALYIDDAMN